MKKIIALFLFFVSNAIAQPGDYWQQHVSYTISGTLIDSIHSFDGKLSVVYTNNSPDTLHEVWFHLYYNAFQPGSMMYERAKALNDRGLFEKMDHYRRSDWGEQIIKDVLAHIIYATTDDISFSKPRPAKFEVSGTIMKVYLEYPLAPHSSIEISMPFFVQIPLLTRRGGWMNDAGIKYSMSQWYPKICEYDREGWHHQEYVAREFYGVYGDFDVTMTVPSKFCVGATGQCQNPDEVGWGYDQIAHGIKKGKVYPDSVKQDGMKTWHFKASNVHDFAWVAHEYIHEWDTWSDTVTVHCLYKPSEEKYWSEAMPNTFTMLSHHSKKVGWYQYRNFTNTHGGDGGMEYPQLIMDGSPGLGLIMHEGGHQWFYGMIGNNETRYAYLDEGFTEFIEMTGVEATYGRHSERNPYRDSSWLTNTFIPQPDIRRDYYRSYLDLASSGYEEPLTIPHDWFRENVNAGQVYFKTLAGLAQLEYVLGDSMFWAGMKEYFRRWHFHHPNLNDFKRTMQDVSGADLDYYFDEWFGTTRTIDYGACGLNSDKQDDGTYKTTVKLRNKNLAVLPVDLTLHYNDGSTGIATIPLAVNQNLAYKKPEAGRLFFPSWDWVSTKYEGSIITPKEVDWYEIDSSDRMMDLNRRNNTSGLFPKTEWSFLKQLHMAPPLGQSYGVFRPIIGYDEVSKIDLGVGLKFGTNRLSNGDLKLLFKFAPQRYEDGNGLLKPGYTKPMGYDYLDGELKYDVNTPILGRLTKFTFDARKINDIGGINVALEHEIRPEYLYLGITQKIKFNLDYEARGPFGEDNILYPVYPENWDSGFERSFGFSYHLLSSNRRTQVYFSARIGNLQTVDRSFQGDTLTRTSTLNAFSQFGIGISQVVPFSSQMELKLRASFGRTSGKLSDQYEYNISGATNSEMLRNDFFRTIASIGRHFSDQAHFFVEGGAGVRGYTGQLFDPAGNINLNGNDMMGFNADLKLPNPIASLGSFASSFEFGLFGDAGWTGAFQYGNPPVGETDAQVLKHVLTDGGVTVKTTILSWLPWQLQGVASEYGQIPTISFYFPIYLNHPFDGTKNFAFRYVIGLGTTF
jgi:hypothetical protein